LAIAGIISLIAFCVIKNWKLNHRLLKNSRRTGINYYKYMVHAVDIIYLPLVYNLHMYSSCNFGSEKKAIILVDCQTEHENAWGMMLLSQLAAIVIGLSWIVLIFIHLYREKISNILHEEYIIRKEIEYIINLSDNWLTRYFWMFSSYKSETFKMYNRVIFNSMVFL
jgi:hypothetical protein